MRQAAPLSQRAAQRAVRRVLGCGPSRAATLAHAVLAEVREAGCTVLEAEQEADGDLLTNAQAAALLGIAASTWRAYRSRGQAPAPDVWVREHARQATPKWRRSTLVAWRPDA